MLTIKVQKKGKWLLIRQQSVLVISAYQLVVGGSGSRSMMGVVRSRIVITVRVHSCSRRSGVISACSIVSVMKRLVGVLECGRRRRNSGASITSIVGWANVVVVLVGHESTSSDTTNGAELSIAHTLVLLAALPWPAFAAAEGVSVGWARPVTLLLLVMTTEEELDKSGNEEEDSSKDRNGETSRVQSASSSQLNRIGYILVVSKSKTIASITVLRVRISVSKRCVDIPAAAVRTIACQDSDGDESATEEDVEDNGDECEDRPASEEASQQNSEEKIEDCSARHALNCLFPCWNANVVVGED